MLPAGSSRASLLPPMPQSSSWPLASWCAASSAPMRARVFSAIRLNASCEAVPGPCRAGAWCVFLRERHLNDRGDVYVYAAELRAVNVAAITSTASIRAATRISLFADRGMASFTCPREKNGQVNSCALCKNYLTEKVNH